MSDTTPPVEDDDTQSFDIDFDDGEHWPGDYAGPEEPEGDTQDMEEVPGPDLDDPEEDFNLVEEVRDGSD